MSWRISTPSCPGFSAPGQFLVVPSRVPRGATAVSRDPSLPPREGTPLRSRDERGTLHVQTAGCYSLQENSTSETSMLAAIGDLPATTSRRGGSCCNSRSRTRLSLPPGRRIRCGIFRSGFSPSRSRRGCSRSRIRRCASNAGSLNASSACPRKCRGSFPPSFVQSQRRGRSPRRLCWRRGSTGHVAPGTARRTSRSRSRFSRMA